MSGWFKSTYSNSFSNCVECRRWRKSSRCAGGECVETAPAGDGMAVRDSKDPGGPVIEFTAAEWRAFLAELTRYGPSFNSSI